MKCFKILILTGFVFLIFSCGLPQISDVTIQNHSGSEITNLVISWKHSEGGRNRTIGTLGVGQTQSFSIEIADRSGNTYVATGTITYTIGEQKFSSNKPEDRISFSSNRKTIITINENGWTYTR